MADKAAANQELLCRFHACQADAYELCRECRYCYCEAHGDHASHLAHVDNTPVGTSEAVTNTDDEEADDAVAEDADSEENSCQIPKRGAKLKATATKNEGSKKKAAKRTKRLATYASSDESENDSEDIEDEEVINAPTRARTVTASRTQPTATRAARPPPRSSAIACTSKNSELLSGAVDFEQQPHLLYGSQVHRCVM